MTRVTGMARLAFARAYVEDLPEEEVVGTLLGPRDELLQSTGDVELDALVYQTVGYVCSERYGDHALGVRLLTLSYQVGYDNFVLESLGAAYYFMAVAPATRDDDTVDREKIDRYSLFKARECFDKS